MAIQNSRKLLLALKNTITYFGGAILGQGIVVLSIPLFINLLGPEDFGLVSVFSSISLLVIHLMTLNIPFALNRYYYEKINDLSSYIFTVIVCTLFSISFFSCVLMMNREYISKCVNIPENYILLLIPTVLGLSFWNLYQQLLIGRKRSLKMSANSFSLNLLKVALALIFILSIESIGYYKILGETVAVCIIGLYCLIKLLKYVRFNFNLKHLHYSLLVGIPLLPYSISNMVLSFFDQWMINVQLGNSEAGLYSFAYRIGFVLMSFFYALSNAFGPEFYRMMNSKEPDQVFSQSKFMLKLTLVAASSMILFSYEGATYIITNDSYYEAIELIPIVVMGYFIYCVYQFQSRVIYFHKRNIYLSLITIVAGSVNVILNYIYIPIYGYKIAAYTTLISFTMMPFLGGAIIKYLKLEAVVPWKIGLWGLFVIIFLYIVFVYNGGFLIDHIPSILIIVIKLSVLIGLVISLFKDKITQLMQS